MNKCLALLSLLVLSSPAASASASASVTSAPAIISQASVASSRNATCPYRTINYITHKLPQQCFTSSWRSTTAIATADASEVASGLQIAPSLNSTLQVSVSGEQSHDVSFVSGKTLEPDLVQTSASTALAAVGPTLATQSPAASTESEEPSPLEDEKFMSFEEWKKQNLQKAGQSELIGREKVNTQPQRKRPVNIHSALDSLGDDAEIDLDFSGIIPDGPDLPSGPAATADEKPQNVHADAEAASTPGIRKRSKDAGTTSKERSNYASFDCGAIVRKSNSEAQSAGAVLGENKDNYMLNTCSADNKFLILELCNDLSIDTIVLANFEFFSSMVRTFRVSVSDKYPVKLEKWKTIGNFEACNSREVQAFLIDNPIIWARYVRIEFLTYYGTEYYCPISLVRIHGTTMLEEYNRDAESSLGGEDDDDEADAEPSAGETLVPEAIADPIVDEKLAELSTKMEHATPSASIASPATTSVLTGMTSISLTPTNATSILVQPRTSANPAAGSNLFSTTGSVEACFPSEFVVYSTVLRTTEAISALATNTSTTEMPVTSNLSSTLSPTTGELSTSANITSGKQGSTSQAPSSKVQSSSSKHSIQPIGTDRQRPSTSTQSQAAVPTMQESFFKSVQKRLQLLEANSSLSLQYIEDQSRALRDAFNKVEQRQLAKTTTFLEYLNMTVLSELRDFRQQYDQLWQSTVIELEMQRERYQQENAAINARLGVLADELIFQKRLSILQMILILVCLALVLFAKGALNQYLELPAVQRVLARSPSNRWLSLTNFDTPTQSPPPTREGSTRTRPGILKGHRRMQSEDSIEDSLSPAEMYHSPPTPTSMSFGEQSDGEPIKDEKPALEDPEFDPSTIERPSTSPPVLPSEMPDINDLTGETIDSKLETGLSSPPESPEPAHRDLPGVPQVIVQQPTPDRKHLTWNLPDS